MAQAQWVVQSNSVLVTWYDESTQGTVIVPFQSTITLLTQKRMRSRQLLSATTSRSHKSPHSCNKESALQNSNTAWNSVPPPSLSRADYTAGILTRMVCLQKQYLATLEAEIVVDCSHILQSY